MKWGKSNGSLPIVCPVNFLLRTPPTVIQPCKRIMKCGHIRETASGHYSIALLIPTGVMVLETKEKKEVERHFVGSKNVDSEGKAERGCCLYHHPSRVRKCDVGRGRYASRRGRVIRCLGQCMPGRVSGGVRVHSPPSANSYRIRSRGSQFLRP